MNGLPFTILIVEDDADDRFIIDEAFKQIGYEAEVKKFLSGESLFRYLNEIKTNVYPSLIVLDNTLPKMDASDILLLLKKDTRFHKIPVVVYTSTASPQKKEQLLAHGAYACLEKGALMDEVVTVAKDLKSLAEENVGDQ